MYLNQFDKVVAQGYTNMHLHPQVIHVNQINTKIKM
jgi:hypothetical protein